MRIRSLLLVSMLLALVGAVMTPQRLGAQSLVVTQCSTAAATAGSLTNILNQAQDSDTITFNIGSDCTFALATTITITQNNLTIDATTTSARVILDGGSGRTVLTTQPSNNQIPSVTLKGLTIQHGSGTVGGGISYNGNNGLTRGTLTIDRSVIINNTATVAGGGLYNGGGIVNITNSTLSGNQVTGSAFATGGAITNNSFGTMTIQSSTIARNMVNPSARTASFGGGVENQNGTASTIRLTDTIVANNQGGTCQAPDLVEESGPGTFATGGHNLIGVDHLNGPCGGDDFDGGIINNQNGDQVGTFSAPIDPLFAALGFFGGTTQTQALLPSSPAIDSGGVTCPAGIITDQRGVMRPRGAQCDIGSFESQGFTLSSPTGTPQMAIVNSAFANPLGVTIAAAQGGPPFNEPVNGGMVTFTIIPAGGAGATFGAKPGCTISPDMLTATCAIAGGMAASPMLTANAMAGNYSATVSAAGVPALGAPTYQLSNVPSVAVAPATLANGAFGTPYSQMLTASGGTGTGYTFAAPPAALPPGLTLSSAGLLSGTPTQIGSSTFTVTATDSAAHTGSRQYTVMIAAATTTTAVTNATVPASASAQSVPLAATVTDSVPVNEGTVTFTVSQSGTQVGAQVTSGTVTNGAATATDTLPAGTPAGAYTITAAYTPGPDFTASSGTGTLTVTTATVTGVTVTANGSGAVTLKVGQSVQFKATGTLSDGNTVDLTNQVTWGANKASVTVDQHGLATGVSASASDGGAATLTATYGSGPGALVGHASVTVSTPVVLGIPAPPAPPGRGGAGVPVGPGSGPPPAPLPPGR